MSEGHAERLEAGLDGEYPDGQNCAIPCVDCTVLEPETTPCPTCGGSGTDVRSARMCDESIQRGYGEKSGREYRDFKRALEDDPGNAELLRRYRAWIREALAYSLMYPAWSAAFRGVPVVQDRGRREGVLADVQESLRADFEESGRLLGK